MERNDIRYRDASKLSGYSISTISELLNDHDKKISYYFVLAKSIGMTRNQLLSIEYNEIETDIVNSLSALSEKQKQLIYQLLQSR